MYVDSVPRPDDYWFPTVSAWSDTMNSCSGVPRFASSGKTLTTGSVEQKTRNVLSGSSIFSTTASLLLKEVKLVLFTCLSLSGNYSKIKRWCAGALEEVGLFLQTKAACKLLYQKRVVTTGYVRVLQCKFVVVLRKDMGKGTIVQIYAYEHRQWVQVSV